MVYDCCSHQAGSASLGTVMKKCATSNEEDALMGGPRQLVQLALLPLTSEII